MTSTPNIPQHLGIILDGNRRWAKKRLLPSMQGHKKGYETLKTIADAALDKGVKYLTAYVFSTENWSRSKTEVSGLMDFALYVARNEVEELHKKNIKIVFIGSREKLSAELSEAISAAEEKTANNTKGTIGLCFNYGGHRELVAAVKAIVDSGVAAEDINEETIAKNLYHPEIPPIDLVLRTSGEQRISNFMLWRSAYSELIFVDKHWPAFTEADLDDVLLEYGKRQRRFGV